MSTCLLVSCDLNLNHFLQINIKRGKIFDAFVSLKFFIRTSARIQKPSVDSKLKQVEKFSLCDSITDRRRSSPGQTGTSRLGPADWDQDHLLRDVHMFLVLDQMSGRPHVFSCMIAVG